MNIQLDNAKNTFYAYNNSINWNITELFTVNTEIQQQELLLFLVDQFLNTASDLDLLTNDIDTKHNIVIIVPIKQLRKVAYHINLVFGSSSVYKKQIIARENLPLDYKDITSSIFVVSQLPSFKTNMVAIMLIQDTKDWQPVSTQVISRFDSMKFIRFIWHYIPKIIQAIPERKKPIPVNKRYIAGLEPVPPPEFYIEFDRLLKTLTVNNHISSKVKNYLLTTLLNIGPYNAKQNLLKHQVLPEGRYPSIMDKVGLDPKLEKLKDDLQQIQHLPDLHALIFTPSKQTTGYLLHHIDSWQMDFKVRANLISGAKPRTYRKMSIKQEKDVWGDFESDDHDILILQDTSLLSYKDFSFSRLTDLIFYGVPVKELVFSLYHDEMLEFFDTRIHLIHIKDTQEENKLWNVLRM